MQGKITVAPAPQSMELIDGSLSFNGFVLACREDVFALHTRRKLAEYLCAGGVPLRTARKSFENAEAYELTIDENGATLFYGTQRALHYAVLTLLQIAKACRGSLPYVRIADAPDFAIRGFMYDISRNRVPTLDTLKSMADILSDLKMNMFQLYVEGRSYYYESEKEFYADKNDFLTPEDVAELDRYCAERFVDLTPCGNCLGHFVYWLNTDKYAHLSYSPGGFEWWEDGLHAPAGTLDPSNGESNALVYKLFDGLLAPYDKPKFFNIGGDEPFDMLFGKRALDDGGETYISYMSQVCENVRARGITPMLWADVAHKHADKLDRLGDAVFLEWRYEAGGFDDEACSVYKDMNARFIVCPSSSLCNDFTGKTDNMLANLCEAAHYGKKYGALGYLNTEWGDGGSSQSHVSGVYGMGVSACYAWNADGTDVDAAGAYLNANVYDCALADIVADLGRYVDCQEQKIKGIPFLFSALYIRQTDGINRDRNNYSDPTAFFWRDELLTKSECDKTAELLSDIRARIKKLKKVKQNLFVREAEYCLNVLDWALAHTRLCLDLKKLCDTKEQVRELLFAAKKCVAEREALWKLRYKKSDMDLSMYRYKALIKKYESLLNDR